MGDLTLNNIKVDRSTIGVLSTGTIKSVDAAVSNLRDSGQSELSSAILQLTEAVLKSSEVNNDEK